MFCSKCGREIPENENVCPNCGNRVKNAPAGQRFELSDAKGMLDSGISNAKSSWNAMGKTGILLAVLAGLLAVCMFLWRGNIISVSAEMFGFKYTDGASGMDILNHSGLLSFVITVLYLAAIGAIAYPFVTRTAVTKLLLLPAKVATGFNLGALVGALIVGMMDAGDMLEYVTVMPSLTGILLIACFVAVWVLCFMVEKEN